MRWLHSITRRASACRLSAIRIILGIANRAYLFLAMILL
ncbi:hypothetical protein yfred0001_18530 [Yersinia frederiksenii ATCC 33641]|nr:hypothetical protein yfred0001_18530 [Yersinia frederiksenii ATCC 33641]